MVDRDSVWELLAQVCGTERLLDDPDLDLFENELLDSLGMFNLLVLLEDELGVEIQPTQVPHDAFRTPKSIVDLVLSLHSEQLKN